MKLQLAIALFLLAPVLTAQEWPVTPAVPVPGVFSEYPAAATSGDLTLVVWSDVRALGDVYAARLDAAGHVLDPAGILIAHGRGLPAVTATPSGNFLVVLAGRTPCGEVDTVKVSRNGVASALKTLSDSTPRCVNNLQMATNGDSILLLMDGGRYRMLDDDGNATLPEITLNDRTTLGAVASNGRGYLIYVGGVSTLVARRAVSGPVQVAPLPADVASPFALASNGTSYMLVTLGTLQLNFQPVTSDGKLTGSPREARLTGVPSAIRLTFDGSSYVAAWTQDAPPTLYAGRATEAGELHDVAAIGPALPAFALTPSVLVRIDSSQQLLARPHGGNDTNVVTTPSLQMPPLMASTRDGAALLWTEISPPALRAAMLDAAGRPNGKVAVIRAGFVDGYFLDFDGTRLVVAWLEGRDLFARRYTTSLDPIDAAPIAIAKNAGYSSLAAGGGTALLLWELGGAILTPSGAVVPVELPNPSRTYFSTAAWNGRLYLVARAYAASVVGFSVELHIQVFRVGSQGGVFDTVPLTLARLKSPLWHLTVARNGPGYLVAWLPREAGVTGKFVTADGTTDASDPQPLSPPGATGRFFLAPYGDTTIVSWGSQPAAGDVLVQWRFAGGDIQTLPLMRSSSLPVPALATIGPRIVISYQRIDDDAGGVPRIFARSVYAPRVRAAR